MSHPSLPRRFVASGPVSPPDEHAGGGPCLLDVFRATSDPESPEHTKHVVYRDAEGRLRLAGPDEALPAEVREQLVAHEAISPLRHLVGLGDVHLLEVDGALGLPDTPGVDDPLWLCGRLHGPFPLGGAVSPPSVTQGKLSVTRRELLRSALAAAPHAVHVAEGPRAGRVYNLLLPGDEDDAIAQGRGAIIAYARAEAPGVGPAGNEPETARLLHAILNAMHQDLGRAHSRGVFASSIIPDARDRFAWEEEASRPAPPARGWLSRALGLFVTTAAPQHARKGTTEGLLRLTRLALDEIGGGLSARMSVLLSRLRVTEAFWTPREAVGLRPVPQSGNGAFRLEDEAIVLPASVAARGGNVNFAFTEEVLHHGRAADLDVEAEYLDLEGTIAFCHRPVGSERYAQVHVATMTGSREWKTLRVRAPGALLNLTLWNSDIDFYCVSKRDVRLRKVAVRLAPPSAQRKEVGMRWAYLARSGGGAGWLDHIGSVPKPNALGTPYRFPRTAGLALDFDLVITYEPGGSGDGEAYLVLSGPDADYSIPAPLRTDAGRPDVVKAHGPAYTRACRKGVFRPAEVPPGVYRVLLRLLLPDGIYYVQVEEPLSIEVMDEGFRTVLKGGAAGNLEAFGKADFVEGSTAVVSRDEDSLVFSGWVADKDAGRADGTVRLCLTGDGGQHAYEAASRRDRQDVADSFKNPNLLGAGFIGFIRRQDMPPPGLYAAFLELWRPDRMVYVSLDTGRRVKVVERASDLPASGRKVVFHDPRYPFAWVGRPDLIARHLEAQGFERLDADALRDFMERAVTAGAAGSVCVFANDVVPDTVCEEKAASALIRRFLDRGGRVVWQGDVPFYYQGHRNGSRTTWGPAGQKQILGIGGCAQSRAAVVVTEEGRRWGLDRHGDARRTQHVSELTLVLTRAGADQAESWLKNFDPAHPRSGFLRCFVGGVNGKDEAQMANLTRLARYGLAEG